MLAWQKKAMENKAEKRENMGNKENAECAGRSRGGIECKDIAWEQSEAKATEKEGLAGRNAYGGKKQDAEEGERPEDSGLRAGDIG